MTHNAVRSLMIGFVIVVSAAPAQHLSLHIALERDTLLVGENLLVVAYLINKGGDVITIPSLDPDYGLLTFEIRGRNGQLLPKQGGSSHPSENPVNLGTFDTVGTVVNLSFYYGTRKTGHIFRRSFEEGAYSIRARFRLRSIDRPQKEIDMVSEAIQVQFLYPSADELMCYQQLARAERLFTDRDWKGYFRAMEEMVASCPTSKYILTVKRELMRNHRILTSGDKGRSSDLETSILENQPNTSLALEIFARMDSDALERNNSVLVNANREYPTSLLSRFARVVRPTINRLKNH